MFLHLLVSSNAYAVVFYSISFRNINIVIFSRCARQGKIAMPKLFQIKFKVLDLSDLHAADAQHYGDCYKEFLDQQKTSNTL